MAIPRNRHAADRAGTHVGAGGTALTGDSDSAESSQLPACWHPRGARPCGHLVTTHSDGDSAESSRCRPSWDPRGCGRNGAHWRQRFRGIVTATSVLASPWCATVWSPRDYTRRWRFRGIVTLPTELGPTWVREERRSLATAIPRNRHSYQRAGIPVVRDRVVTS